MDLIHKLEKARTKDELEDLGTEHLGVDVDKRKAKEVLRAELIGEAESQGFAAEADNQTEQPAPPVAPEPAKTGYAGKMGRNRNTGRVMPWTSAMAGMPHMEEM